MPTRSPPDRGGPLLSNGASGGTLRRRARRGSATVWRARAVISRENSTDRGLHPAGRRGLNASMACESHDAYLVADWSPICGRAPRRRFGTRLAAGARRRLGFLLHALRMPRSRWVHREGICSFAGHPVHYTNPTLKVYDGAWHGMCAMQKDQVDADLLSFLEGLNRRRAAGAEGTRPLRDSLSAHAKHDPREDDDHDHRHFQTRARQHNDDRGVRIGASRARQPDGPTPPRLHPPPLPP